MGRPRIIADKLVLADGTGKLTPITRTELLKVFQDNGITPEFLAKVLKKMLEATDKEGNPDNAAQLRALGMVIGDYLNLRKVAPSKADRKEDVAENPLNDVLDTARERMGATWAESQPLKPVQ